ncbi:MAG TPA: hypothetical protein VHN98_00030 [Acidimicrobiales bacterium]|nr:hypothetical protein [Acidimicrobiales bacterium]
MTVRLVAGTPTGVGSLPYTDPAVAAEVALEMHPELPAAPQLPQRSIAESMIAQVAAGMPGVTIDGAGLHADRRIAPVPEGAPLDADAWAGTLAFLDAAATRVRPVKLQLAGPVTLGLALIAAGARPSKAFAVAGATVADRVRALRAAADERCPGAPPVIVLDEPGMVSYLHTDFPLAPDDTIDLLSGALAAVGRGGLAGVHCCGPTDWRLILHAGPDLVSLPVDSADADDAAGFSSFLDRGGWIAWGVVPTDRPIGDRFDPHWRRLSALWGEMTRNGCDPARLRTQSLLTPACGLAHHGEEQVPRVFGLVRMIAERVQDQAVALRMSVGA